jgi:hypothetical protein
VWGSTIISRQAWLLARQFLLGARHADRDWQAQHRPHPAPDRGGDLRWRTEEIGAARYVRKGFVDGNSLDEDVKSLSTLMAAPPRRW